MGVIATQARIGRAILCLLAHAHHASAFGFSMLILQMRLPACAIIASPTPSDALLLVPNTFDPLGSGTSPTMRSSMSLVKMICSSFGAFINSSSMMILGLALAFASGPVSLNRLDT